MSTTLAATTTALNADSAANAALDKIKRADPLAGYFARQIALEGLEGDLAPAHIVEQLVGLYGLSANEADAIVSQVDCRFLHRA